MKPECLFCQIVHKKTATELLYENDILVVFRDIYPKAPIHHLIVPKKHIRSINDLEPDDASIIWESVRVAQEMAVRELISKSGYKLSFNVEKGGGQMIFHLHLHLVGGWTHA